MCFSSDTANTPDGGDLPFPQHMFTVQGRTAGPIRYWGDNPTDGNTPWAFYYVGQSRLPSSSYTSSYTTLSGRALRGGDSDVPALPSSEDGSSSGLVVRAPRQQLTKDGAKVPAVLPPPCTGIASTCIKANEDANYPGVVQNANPGAGTLPPFNDGPLSFFNPIAASHNPNSVNGQASNGLTKGAATCANGAVYSYNKYSPNGAFSPVTVPTATGSLIDGAPVCTACTNPTSLSIADAVNCPQAVWVPSSYYAPNTPYAYDQANPSGFNSPFTYGNYFGGSVFPTSSASIQAPVCDVIHPLYLCGTPQSISIETKPGVSTNAVESETKATRNCAGFRAAPNIPVTGDTMWWVQNDYSVNPNSFSVQEFAVSRVTYGGSTWGAATAIWPLNFPCSGPGIVGDPLKCKGLGPLETFTDFDVVGLAFTPSTVRPSGAAGIGSPWQLFAATTTQIYVSSNPGDILVQNQVRWSMIVPADPSFSYRGVAIVPHVCKLPPLPPVPSASSTATLSPTPSPSVSPTIVPSAYINQASVLVSRVETLIPESGSPEWFGYNPSDAQTLTFAPWLGRVWIDELKVSVSSDTRCSSCLAASADSGSNSATPSRNCLDAALKPCMIAERIQSMHFPYLARDWTYTYDVATCESIGADCSNWAQHATAPIVKRDEKTIFQLASNAAPWQNTPNYFVSDPAALFDLFTESLYPVAATPFSPRKTGLSRPPRSYQVSSGYVGPIMDGSYVPFPGAQSPVSNLPDTSFVPLADGSVPLVWTPSFCTYVSDNTCPGTLSGAIFGSGPIYGMSAMSTPGTGNVTYEKCGVAVSGAITSGSGLTAVARDHTGVDTATVQDNLNNALMAGRQLQASLCTLYTGVSVVGGLTNGQYYTASNQLCCSYKVTTRAIYEPGVMQYENYFTDAFIHNAHVLTLPTTDMTLGQITQSQDSCAVSVAGVDFPADLSAYVGSGLPPGVKGWTNAAGNRSGVGLTNLTYLQAPKILNTTTKERESNQFVKGPKSSDPNINLITGLPARRLAFNPAKSSISRSSGIFSQALPLTVGRIGGKGWNTFKFAHMMPVGTIHVYGGSPSGATTVTTKYTSNPVLMRSWADLPRSAALSTTEPGTSYASRVFYASGHVDSTNGPVMGRCWYGRDAVQPVNKANLYASKLSSDTQCQFPYTSYVDTSRAPTPTCNCQILQSGIQVAAYCPNPSVLTVYTFTCTPFQNLQGNPGPLAVFSNNVKGVSGVIGVSPNLPLTNNFSPASRIRDNWSANYPYGSVSPYVGYPAYDGTSITVTDGTYTTIKPAQSKPVNGGTLIVDPITNIIIDGTIHSTATTTLTAGINYNPLGLTVTDYVGTPFDFQSGALFAAGSQSPSRSHVSPHSTPPPHTLQTTSWAWILQTCRSARTITVSWACATLAAAARRS